MPHPVCRDLSLFFPSALCCNPLWTESMVQLDYLLYCVTASRYKHVAEYHYKSCIRRPIYVLSICFEVQSSLHRGNSAVRQYNIKCNNRLTQTCCRISLGRAKSCMRRPIALLSVCFVVVVVVVIVAEYFIVVSLRGPYNLKL